MEVVGTPRRIRIPAMEETCGMLKAPREPSSQMMTLPLHAGKREKEGGSGSVGTERRGRCRVFLPNLPWIVLQTCLIDLRDARLASQEATNLRFLWEMTRSAAGGENAP